MSFHVLKLAAVVIGPAALGFSAYALASNQDSFPYRCYRSYVAYLERLLRSMFVPLRGRTIVIGQGIALALAIITAPLFPFWWALLPPVGYGPVWYIKSLRSERVRAIEKRMDGFILTVANALKTTPSIGNALAYSQPLIPSPMDQELLLALKEMRLGNTVDQALLNMTSRIGSQQLSVTMTGMLIGRQVGGDLPTILITTATTLREMSRLQGVLRAKTADGRIQIAVMTFLPVALLGGFDFVKPGYFNPLFTTVTGWFVTGIAILLWGVALGLAHRFLKVDI